MAGTEESETAEPESGGGSRDNRRIVGDWRARVQGWPLQCAHVEGLMAGQDH